MMQFERIDLPEPGIVVWRVNIDSTRLAERKNNLDKCDDLWNKRNHKLYK